jgi:hypothetical protein
MDNENKRFLNHVDRQVADKLKSLNIEKIDQKVHKLKVIVNKNKAEI